MTTHQPTRVLVPSTTDSTSDSTSDSASDFTADSSSHPARAVGRGRRSLLAVTGLLACAVPAVFAVNITRMLLTGVESEHRFHQLTGQGEILCALWLVPILLLVRAGWHGRVPSTAAGWAHLVLVLAGAGCAVVSQGGGAPVLMAVVGIPGALLWASLPVRPRLLARVQLDPLMMPVALAASAVLLPYAVDQLALQNAATTGYHSQNPHYFDMAWISIILAAHALLAGLLPAARALAVGFAAAMVWTGAAGLALGESVPWSVSVVVCGVLAGAAWAVGRRRAHRN